MSVTFSALGCRLQATWITEEIVKYKSGNPQNAIIPDFKRSIKTILLQFHYRNCWDDSIFTKTILPKRNPGLFQYGLPGFILHSRKNRQTKLLWYGPFWHKTFIARKFTNKVWNIYMAFFMVAMRQCIVHCSRGITQRKYIWMLWALQCREKKA